MVNIIDTLLVLDGGQSVKVSVLDENGENKAVVISVEEYNVAMLYKEMIRKIEVAQREIAGVEYLLSNFGHQINQYVQHEKEKSFREGYHTTVGRKQNV